jgi:hypothetical protein
VPWQWVDASTRPVAETRWGGGGGYGYLWWIRPEEERGAYTANGFGGQYIYVSRAATETSKGREWRRDLFTEIREGIVGSVISRGPANLRSTGSVASSGSAP